MNVVTESLLPGTVIQDTYKITGLLGEGGMGATFAGRNLATEHDVAIKVISASMGNNERVINLFKREANLLRSIQHEAVVRYETTLQDKEGRLYLIMEMLDGQPLSYYVTKGARLAPEDVLRLGRRLASALDAIATVGMVHRDIAPDNIFVPDGDIQNAKLIDFGLASDTVGTEKTILGDDFAGKFSYCAPEQLGINDAEVSTKTDVYALGLVLMKISGLAVPGEGEGIRAGVARRDNIVVPPDTVGRELSDVLNALLKSDPTERPSPLTPVFDRALKALNDPDAGLSDKTKINVQKVQQRETRKKALPLTLGGVALAVLLGGGYYVYDTFLNTAGKSSAQIEGGKEILNDPDDPLAKAISETKSSNFDDRNSALIALLAIGKDKDETAERRVQAYTVAAEMADPATFDASESAFKEPSPRTALRYYKDAASLGADVSEAINRLEN